ncbi:MAG: DNA-directed RNA polymerase specialized sigma subunit, sigma24 family [Chloroflexi bacterium AL-W]|nr:DNA-directed RNA polymerase specialized sigma subunit, sigma24 family [Chloroflexi bacterium AL-N1]NOK67028.1 DNA-directed RNA polymerase specialized sigma subunit, sigma24 family [Chloroflexi bacterium AL-N10]NOK74680.1 DNA-directed RNA polymerase specialized sigma subunit, sigma24 family [Chloroflexi bacterium AL-N5]NOK81630.1 DNA-directed RNA polymerase specialized sigma subunit, sigma24 family [Chloroflexi bacterium AL-W]NOK89100.1 DNA-directed RNA polymerase specialized sigma subunit, s
MLDETDVGLLERVAQNDEAAFEILFQRYYSQVYRVLYHLVGRREEAEDLLQETFLTLYRKPPRLASGTEVIAWLCRVALNRGYNALRGQRRSRERLERLVEPPPSIDPDDEVLRTEVRSEVRAVLRQLPERQAKLLLLRYAGLSYAEIAETLHVSTGSVGTLLSRAERAFLVLYEQSVPVTHTNVLDTRTP